MIKDGHLYMDVMYTTEVFLVSVLKVHEKNLVFPIMQALRLMYFHGDSRALFSDDWLGIFRMMLGE